MAAYAKNSRTTGRFIARDRPQFDIRNEYPDGYNLYQYAVGNPVVFQDPSGLISQDYPHTLPPKTNKPCNKDDFLDLRWWSGFWASFYELRKPNGDDADGTKRNAFAHCYAACRVHEEMPECDNNWEQSEWKNGKPKDHNSDLDIRNNNVGRDIADNGGDCWFSITEKDFLEWSTKKEFKPIEITSPLPYFQPVLLPDDVRPVSKGYTFSPPSGQGVFDGERSRAAFFVTTFP